MRYAIIALSGLLLGILGWSLYEIIKMADYRYNRHK